MASHCVADELRVPAFTAYMLPNPESARVSEQKGITRWNDPAQSINWYGRFASIGDLKIKTEMVLSEGTKSRFKLTVEEDIHEATVTGLGTDKPVDVDFGVFKITTPGHKRLRLESLNETKGPIGDVKSIVLDGVAVDKVHFNLKERRNAASVHLMYPVPDGADVEAFYCEVTAIEDPTTTFYMACGWHRGYFGMQVNSSTERRVIFSVWDSGNEAVDRKNVDDENRVKLMGKGEGVFTGNFGNEGTGGHSHLKTKWKTGEKQRFLVTAKPVDKTTIFSGFWFQQAVQTVSIDSWVSRMESSF